MKRDWFVLIFILAALATIAYSAVNLRDFLEGRIQQRHAEAELSWNFTAESLKRQCNAAWPLRGEHYQACLNNIQAMHRDDI